MSTEIEAVTLAVTAMNRVEAGLAELRSQYQGVIFEVTTTAGMESAKEARRAVRGPRLEVEQIRKAAKAPILALGKKLDTEAARITAELEKLEDPIHAQIVAEEQRKEREKEAKIAAELARVKAIQDRIEAIRAVPLKATGKSSAEVQAIIDSFVAIPDDSFQEFEETAAAAWTTSSNALTGILVQAQALEAEQARIQAEREELAKLRAEAAEREKVAAEERAKQEAAAKAERDRLEAIAKAERDAEAARQAEANRLERERIQAEEAAAKAIRDAEEAKLRAERLENERIAAERRAELDRQEAEAKAAQAVETARQEAEAKRLADERAAFEAQQEAARLAALPKPRKTKAKIPTEQEILQVLSTHYSVTDEIARGWLSVYQWKSEVAA